MSSTINWNSVRNHGQTDIRISVDYLLYSNECCINYMPESVPGLLYFFQRISLLGQYLFPNL